MVTKQLLPAMRKEQESASQSFSISTAHYALLALIDFEQNEGKRAMKQILFKFCAISILLCSAVALQAKEITVRGHLQQTVEPGGWLISADGAKYLILNARTFQNNSWFKESALVEAVGEEKPDVVTTYMEGTPFEARTMRLIEQSGANAGNVAKRMTRVMVSGDSIVQAQPDTAILTISVVTQAKRAIDAQQENAARSDAVMRAIKAAAGPGAEVKTSGYSLQPQRVYKEGQPPSITGYEARNTVTVTLGDLTKVGAVIDAAGGVGANDVTGISFTLRQDRLAREQALKEATREAISKAQVIAQALGGQVIRIVEVQEEGFQKPPQPYQQPSSMARTSGAATPIEVGTLEISSKVQVIAEVETSL
jgi:uncharacterized protein YggE